MSSECVGFAHETAYFKSRVPKRQDQFRNILATYFMFDHHFFCTDVPPVGDAGKSDTLGSTGSARKRGGGAKKAMQANKSALRAPRALCCLTLSNPIRMAALALVEWKYPFLKITCV